MALNHGKYHSRYAIFGEFLPRYAFLFSSAWFLYLNSTKHPGAPSIRSRRLHLLVKATVLANVREISPSYSFQNAQIPVITHILRLESFDARPWFILFFQWKGGWGAARWLYSIPSFVLYLTDNWGLDLVLSFVFCGLSSGYHVDSWTTFDLDFCLLDLMGVAFTLFGFNSLR